MAYLPLRRRPAWRHWGCTVALGAVTGVAGAADMLDVDVVGLFAGKAVVVINGGTPRTLAAGQSTPEGVRLIRADSAAAEFEIAGKRQTLGLGRGHYGGGPAAGNAMATLYADGSGHFISEGSINGSTVRFLLDTGATSVAMNGRDAARIGIDYKRGKRELVATANGVVTVYAVKLDTVRIGAITLHNVDAVVHAGEHPAIVLVGMSFLNQVDMKRDGALMTLTKRF